MKKFLLLLLAIPLIATLAACDDDDDTPKVKLQLTYSGATADNNILYVVSGDTLKITALNAIPEEGTKKAAISSATYYWDGLPVFRTMLSPFPLDIDTEGLTVGNHTLGVYANVLQVDKSLGFAVTEFPVVIVADDTQLPGDNNDGGGTLTPDTHMSKTEK